MAAWIIDKNFSVWMFLLVVNIILLLAGNVMVSVVDPPDHWRRSCFRWRPSSHPSGHLAS